MLSRPWSRPKKATRRVAPRVTALEARYLLSADLGPIAPAGFASPVAIALPISASSVGVIPPGSSSAGADASQSVVTYTPTQIRHAYGVDQLSLTGAGQTIAIVDAYDDQTIAADLAQFDSTYKLPAASLVKLSETGGSTTGMATNSGWATETSLDVEWAHAIAPGATILLIEATTASYSDLLTADHYAITQTAYPVSQLSMSWGGGEFSGDATYDSDFSTPGISFFASSGDNGQAVSYPAVSPFVTAVGGTTLQLDSSGNKTGETAWSGSGGGVSTTVNRPSFQNGFETASYRGVPDVSYDADPYTGVAVIQNGSTFGVGGTSAGSPQWAGLLALANQGRANAGLSPVGTGLAFGTNSALYALAGSGSYTNPGGDFADITSGSNGLPAGPGYDNVTGLGSPVANNLIPALVGKAASVSSSASFVGTDTTTQGTWSGTYGASGYEVIGGTTSLPAYATVTPSGQQSYTWNSSTTDTRAPQVAPGSSSRVAATLYSATSFNVALNLADGNAHQVSAYLLDWDGEGRVERVDVLDAATGTVLSTQTASSFSGGDYLTWNLTGNVILRFTNVSGNNAVLSGLFIGGAPSKPGSSASFVGSDTTTQGTWSSTYGASGYDVIGGTTSLPSYATVTPSGQQSYTWASSTTDARALQAAPGSSSRVAATWYSATSFSVAVNLSDGQAHQVSAYLLDWDGQGRSEEVDVIDAASGTVLNTQTASSFSGGEYLTWNLTGNVILKFTDITGGNAVLSGLFIGGAPSKPSSTASFVGSDTTTQGTWTGTYGSAGYDVIGGSSSIPSYATVKPSGQQQSYTWNSSTADVRAPQVAPGSSSRVAATWYSATSFTVGLNLTDGQAHKVSIYLLDWDGQGRSEEVDVIDAATGTILNTQTASSFSGGEYLTWNLSGNVILRFSNLGGSNAVLSGLDFS